jgi:signal transduction histidine kinase
MVKEPDPQLAEETKALRLMLSHGFSALLSVPLLIKEKDYGGITLYYRRAREFSEEEIQLAMAVADQAALAIENTRLRGEAEQAAAFAERSRLARELHDSVTQSLYSITLYSEAISRMLAAGAGTEAVDHLRELRATAQEALREMRLLIFELSPPALDKGGLVGALQMRLDAVEARGGMNADLRVEGSECLKPAVRQELYQIAQEALNNALKHAHNGGRPGPSGRGLGLRGMRERAQAIGGTLGVESSPEKGTKVSILVPVDR